MAFESWAHAEKVCVIGAGTMGSGIAAHLANLGFDVTLLDMTKESVQNSFSRAKAARPPVFYVPDTANKIRLGSIDENFDWVSEADWVCEVVTEQLEIKQALFERIDEVLNSGAMISSNTSGLEIASLAQGRSDSFRKRFLGTHFFNPPRYLKLLELIPTPETDPQAVKAMTALLEDRCARRVVPAKDTPGFIANRFGMWAMYHAIHTAERLHLSIDQVDAITGPFLGRPRSASFRLNDIVGLDVMQAIANNLLERCTDDPGAAALAAPRSFRHLIEKGWIGEKVGRGFYRREGRELLVLDLNTFAYRQRQEIHFESLDAMAKKPLGERVRAALELRDEAGEFLRNHLVPVLQYANRIKEEVSHSVLDFDRVMKWGFGWEQGPFEMIDSIGPEVLGLPNATFYKEGQVSTFKGGFTKVKAPEEYRTLQDFEVKARHENFLLRDLGDKVTAVSFTTKQGVITPALVDELTAQLTDGKLERIVLTSEAKNFSVGFDLTFFMSCIQAVDVTAIEKALIALQSLGELLERQKAVSAVHGYCLGAGCELALSTSQIIALAEAQIGLPESRVGLIPGGRGTVLMRLQQGPQAKALAEAAVLLTKGATCGNADEARASGLLRDSDVTVYHPDRLIYEAKKAALVAKPKDRPSWQPVEGPLTGMIDRLMAGVRKAGEITEYDEQIGQKIKAVFAKATSYEDALERERAEFTELCFRALSQARIKHMLENGKPLRN